MDLEVSLRAAFEQQRMLGDDFVGLHVGEMLDLAKLGAPGRVIEARTLGAAMTALVASMPSLSSALDMRLELDDRSATLSCRKAVCLASRSADSAGLPRLHEAR